MDDEEFALVVATKILLAKPSEREEVLRAEIPLGRLGRVLPLVPVAMGRIFDGFTTSKKLRLAMEGVMRTFLQKIK